MMSSPPGLRSDCARQRRRAAAAKKAVKGGAEVSAHRLRNGLRVLVAQRRADPIVAVMLYYRVGSRNEREHEAGLSHFLEHMMFKGSRGYGKGEVDRVTTELGGQNNAFTGKDHTAYWFELASDRWESALAIEADRMRGLLIDPAEFDAERAVVLEELAMGEDDPWRVLSQQVEAALFPRHPYGRPIIGYCDSLARLRVEDMRDYYERFYHPGNGTLVIAGDVSKGRALGAARKHFGGLECGTEYERADFHRPPLEEPRGELRLKTSWDDSASRLCIAWPTAAVGTDDDYALDLLSSALTSGRTSRLQRRLVHSERLATSVSSNNDARVEGGCFWLFAECAHGVAPERLEAAIDEELDAMARECLRPAELRRVRALMRSAEAYESETISDLAEDLGSFAVDAHWSLAIDGCERYEALGAARLRDTMKRLLRPDRRVLGWSLPREDSRAGGGTR